MKLIFDELTLFCKQSEEVVTFGRRLSFFHGEMSTGKSTIAEMINFCLGSSLVKTPAINSELVSVTLSTQADNTEILLERSKDAGSKVQVTWSTLDGQKGLEMLPLSAEKDPVVGDDIHNLSDFLLRSLGSPVLKVKKRKGEDESELHRLSFRDFYKFCYLDQQEIDSSLFDLEKPIIMEKSKDVMRYVLGFHSDRLNELQSELSNVRLHQRSMREAAKQIGEFLNKYGFNSLEAIDSEVDQLNDEEERLVKEIENQQGKTDRKVTLDEESEQRQKLLTVSIGSKSEAINEVNKRIGEQEALIAEFVSMKLKVARSTVASEILGGADYDICPSCGTAISDHAPKDACGLCKSDLSQAPGSPQSGRAVIEQDLTDRIDDLKVSVSRLKRSADRQKAELASLTENRAVLLADIEKQRRSFESEFVKRTRAAENRMGAIKERRSFLAKVKGMPMEVEAKLKEADGLSTRIDELQREIAREQQQFESGRSNLKALELNLQRILKAIHFPEFKETDRIVLNQKTWLPSVLPNGVENLAWTFSDAGSGGKMVLFKIAFALALHVTASQRQLPLPRVLIIDSPMKNITPDINPQIFEYFYEEVYRLLMNELADWQCIIIDQTYHVPPEGFPDHTERKLTNSDPELPPLISYYHGH